MSTFTKEEFARRLRKQRISAGFDTQKAFAAAADVSIQSINYYEGGERLPDAYILSKLARTIGCSVDYLVQIEDAPTHDVADICAATGLSEKAVSKLVDSKKEGFNLPSGLNYVCESRGYEAFFFALNDFFFGKYLVKGAETVQMKKTDGGRINTITLDNQATDREWGCSMYSHKLMSLEEYYQKIRKISLLDLQEVLTQISKEGVSANGNDNKDKNR